MTEIKVCPECGHVEGSNTIKIGDKLWHKGIHYVIATVDFNTVSGKVGIQLISPDRGSRSAMHPVYVEDIDDIQVHELTELMKDNHKKGE